MALIRAVHTFQSNTGVPADAVVNVTHWTTPDASPGGVVLQEIITKIRKFYDEPTENAPNVCTMLSTTALSSLGARIQLYNLANPKPRSPLVTDLRQAPGFGPSLYPNEVALVLSYSSTPAPGVLQRRRRGRLYLGPLSSQPSLVAGATGDNRPSALAMRTLKQAGERMATKAIGDLVEWVTLSTIDAVTGKVVKGFVDNSYDTQRRRGTRATNRDTFAIPA